MAFLRVWMKASNFNSHHEIGLAIDISDHAEKLTLIECAKKENSSIKGKANYSGGNFHLQLY